MISLDDLKKISTPDSIIIQPKEEPVAVVQRTRPKQREDVCLFCGSKFEVPYSEAVVCYCSKKCRREAHSNNPEGKYRRREKYKHEKINSLFDSNKEVEIAEAVVEEFRRGEKELQKLNSQLTTYFIFPPEHPDRVKIGQSIDVEARLASLNGASPFGLEVYAITETPESDLHSKFAHLHLRFEWFSFNEEVKKWISENAILMNKYTR